MSRSLKKGPYLDAKLMKKALAAKAGNSRSAIKTWARNCQISPEFVGLTFMVHQGKNFISVYVTESMVGHRLGEFAPTRTFKTHGKMTEKSSAKT